MFTDENLAQQIQKGEKQALALLVERHHSLLLGYLYRMTGGDRALAEDLVQEAFLRLLRGIKRYIYPRPFKPWLYTIATNLARDHYKAADARRTINLTMDGEGRNLANEEVPEVSVLEADEIDQVIGALASLPDHQREVVVLRYYQELSLNEISEVLDIPVGTVKSRLSIGLKNLRERLTEEERRLNHEPR